jgi:hypothetical protein
MNENIFTTLNEWIIEGNPMIRKQAIQLWLASNGSPQAVIAWADEALEHNPFPTIQSWNDKELLLILRLCKELCWNEEVEVDNDFRL